MPSNKEALFRDYPQVGLGAGYYSGAKRVHKFGHNGAVGATFETLWGEGGLYVYPAAATIMQVSSSDIDDDDGDTGAWTVEVIGLDGSYDELSDIVTLNGQSQVATSVPFLRVFRMEVLSAGTSLWNEGTIYCGVGSPTAGKPVTVYGLIEPFFNQTLMALYTVPNSFRCYLAQVTISSSIAKQVKAGIFSRSPGETVFRVSDYFSFISGQLGVNHISWERFPEKSDIEIRASAVGGGGDVSAQMQLLLLKKAN